MLKSLKSSGVFLLFFPHYAVAAEAGGDFEEALRNALIESKELRRDGMGQEIASYEVVRARSTFMPRMDISVDDSRISLLSNTQGLESLQLAGRTSANYAIASVKFSLNVFNGGQDQAHLDYTYEKKKEATLKLQRRRAEIAQRLLDRFHAVCQAQFDLLAVDLRLQRSMRALLDVEAGVASGRVPVMKKTDAEFEVKDKELEKGRRNRALIGAMEDLLEMTGHTAKSQLPVSDQWPDVPDYLAALPNFGLEPSAIVTDISLYESRRRAAGTELPKARGRFLPSFDLYAKQDYAGLSTESYEDALNQLQHDKRFVGFTVRWNLFEGMDAWADVKQSALRIESAQADLDLVRQEQSNGDRERARSLAIAEDELALERKRLDLLTMRLEVDRLKVEIGRSEISVLASSEIDLRLQSLEVRRREETLEYAKAKQTLAGGRT